MQFELSAIFFFVGVGITIPLAMLSLGWLLRPKTPNAAKLTIYECGEIPTQSAWFNFNPRFYIVALIFLIFDVEVAFTYPVATVFTRWVRRGLGGVAFFELFVFILILALGLAYVWRHGDLEWIRQAREDTLDKQDDTDKPIIVSHPPVGKAA